MSPTLIVATILMTAALAAYSGGVWAERATRYLKPWHVGAFWLGLTFDGAGTYAMSLLSATIAPEPLHAWTGIAAFTVMAMHALWAAGVLRSGSERARTVFHRFSLAVWLLWLMPYVSGLVFGMTS